jgi:hypothetical protein
MGACLFGSAVQGRCEDFPEKVKQPVDASIELRQSAQKEADQWEEKRQELAVRLDRLSAERDALLSVRDRLRERVEAQRRAVASLQRQLSELDRIAGEILPFLDQVHERLSEWVKRDLPFLAKERNSRLARLREILDDPLVHPSEKFRKTMEALLIEAEYGTTVEVYRQPIELEGREVLTDVFRMGRVSLFFQTLDGTKSGFLDPASRTWTLLPPDRNRVIAAALDMGSRRRSVELLDLPIGRLATP